MKTLNDHLSQYAAYHRDRRNIATHLIGVPMIMFGALLDLTGIRSSSFMLLYGVVWISLIWMYFTEVRTSSVLDRQSAAQSTDQS